jgi:predicted methyltransferase
MRNRSQLFHYIGDPESKSGRSITAGVIKRLEQAGFSQVKRAPRAFGVVALK